MIELHIRPMATDEDGYVEVCLVRQPMDESDGSFHSNESGEASEGETVGYIKVVEGTEDGPVTWWDVKVHDAEGVGPNREHHRRFTDLDTALLSMALRSKHEVDTRRTLGW